MTASAAPQAVSDRAPIAPAPPRRPPSLVRRLIWLAAVWSLLVMLGAGVALTAFFQRAALSRFDQSLYELTDRKSVV